MAESLATQHPAEVWAAFGAAATIIGGLSAYIWNKQNKDIEAISSDVAGQYRRFDEGQKSFSKIGEQFVMVGEQIKALGKEDEYQSEELDRLELSIRELQKSMTILQTQHDDCMKRMHK